MENAVIEIGNTNWMVHFAEDVQGCNVEKIKENLFEKKAAKDIYFFFSHRLWKEENVDMNDILEAEKIIIESKDTQAMEFWASKIKYADVPKIQKAIIESKDAWAMYFFAKEVKDANIEEIRKAIKETNDNECIKRFNFEFKIEAVRKGIFKIFKK